VASCLSPGKRRQGGDVATTDGYHRLLIFHGKGCPCVAIKALRLRMRRIGE
jgi:hypothetical protein